MAEKDEFFLPEEIDRQIESVSQFNEGDRRDAEALAYLRSFYQADARQEQETLDRIWNRIASAPLFEQETQEREKELPMQHSPTHYGAPATGNSRGSHPRRTSLMHRLGILAAAVILVALVGSMALVFYAVRQNNGGTASPHATATLATARCAIEGHFGQYVGHTWIDCGLILRDACDRDLYGSLPRQAQ